MSPKWGGKLEWWTAAVTELGITQPEGCCRVDLYEPAAFQRSLGRRLTMSAEEREAAKGLAHEAMDMNREQPRSQQPYLIGQAREEKSVMAGGGTQFHDRRFAVLRPPPQVPDPDADDPDPGMMLVLIDGEPLRILTLYDKRAEKCRGARRSNACDLIGYYDPNDYNALRKTTAETMTGRKGRR
jgi:hypothetical protein